MFITFSLIELANVGAGLIDGLIVRNFLDAEAMTAAGIAHPIFSISGIFGGMFATGMQTLCSRELGKGDVRSFMCSARFLALPENFHCSPGDVILLDVRDEENVFPVVQ